jgi:hypothetical protein
LYTDSCHPDEQRNIPDDAILHSHHRENLKSYIDILHGHRHQNFQILQGMEGFGGTVVACALWE